MKDPENIIIMWYPVHLIKNLILFYNAPKMNEYPVYLAKSAYSTRHLVEREGRCLKLPL